MSSRFKTVIIALHAPSIDKTVEKFELKPSAAHAAVLQSIRAALGDVTQAWPYTTKHKPVDDFKTITEQQTLLMATDYFEQPLAPSIKDVLIVQSNTAKKA
jgi:hypothetical protein